MNMVEATASCLPRIGDSSTKRQAIKDKLTCAKKQRILDNLAFCAFRSLRGKAGGDWGRRDACWGGEDLLCKCWLRVEAADRVDDERITVLEGKLQIYRNGNGVIHWGLLSWWKNLNYTVMKNEVIHGGLLSWRKNSKNTVIGNGVIDEGLLS